jgi:hypothetical protein
MMVVPSSGIGSNLNAYEAASRLGLATNLKLCLDAGEANGVSLSLIAPGMQWIDLTTNANNFTLGVDSTNKDSGDQPAFGIGYVGEAVAGSINGADVTIVLPTTMVEGDMVVVTGGAPRGVSSISSVGWTTVMQNLNGTLKIGVYYKFMGATPDTTVVCDGSGNAADAAAYVAMVFRGVDPNDIFGANTTVIAASTGSVTTPFIQPANTSIPYVVLSCAGSAIYDTTITSPAYYRGDPTGNAENDTTNDVTVAMAVIYDWYINETPWVGWPSSSPWASYSSFSVLLNPKARVGNRSKNESWKINGGYYDYLSYANATNATWMNNLHKDNAKFTIAAFYYQSSDTVGGYPMMLFENANSSPFFGMPGVGIEVYSKPTTTFFGAKTSTGAWAAQYSVSSPNIYVSDWNFVALSIDEGATNGSFWNHNGTVTSNTVTYVSPSSTDSPASCNYKIYSTAAGMEMGILCVWEGQALSQAQVEQFRLALKKRYDL